MSTFTFTLRDLDTGAGRTGLSCKYRHDDDGFASDLVITITETDPINKPGVYESDFPPTNIYKLWVSGSEEPSFGGDNGRPLVNPDDLLFLSGGTMTGALNMGGEKITNLDDATAATDAMNRQASDARFVKLDGSNDPALWLSVLGGTLDGNLLMHSNQIKNLADATDDQDAVTKAQLDAIETTPYQESPNLIRLIPGGSTKTGQVYTTWNAAMGYLKSLTPSTTKRFVIEIAGMGITGPTVINVTENDGGSPPTNYFNNYISIFIKNRFVKLEIPDDIMTVTANTVSVEGGTIYKNDGAADPVFENMIFVNVYFDLTVNTATFTNCTFQNCFIKVNDDTDGSATFTTCKGSGNTSNQTLPATIQGWSEIPKEDF